MVTISMARMRSRRNQVAIAVNATSYSIRAIAMPMPDCTTSSPISPSTKDQANTKSTPTPQPTLMGKRAARASTKRPTGTADRPATSSPIENAAEVWARERPSSASIGSVNTAKA